ncbi:uncharacterized protein KRP23_13636 [Phytophthora ramorum]|uniref:uncharacterized protein n=1 Tax=Phytophthora ramorum TaxID=164328 RepID=UPI00309DA37A|nr:hypothetical protein KRP23_13636 [Phytophthora ramorum]
MAEAAEISRPMVGSMSGAPVSGSTYRNSEFTREAMDSSMRLTESGGQRDSSTYGPGGQRQTEMKLLAVEPDLGMPPERTKDYKGRIRTWPGLLLLLLIVAGAVALITINAIDVQDQMNINAQRFENASQAKRKIKDGLTDDSVIVSDDGQVGNPKKYPDMGCELPDYQSKNGQIVAVAKNGTEVPVGIKGLNWFGYAGGYMWSLNPESAYQYNPADTYGTFTEGLLEDDWITPNKVFVDGIAALDEIKNLKMFPCFEVEMTSAAGSS